MTVRNLFGGLRLTLSLPLRETKPRLRGLGLVLDSGTPTHHFKDTIQSHSDIIDGVKFGWGTCLVTKDLQIKMDILRDAHIPFYFGGTLFEKYVGENKLEEFKRFLKEMGPDYVEVSNGSIDLSDSEKSRYVEILAKEFRVISEIGYKDKNKSKWMTPQQWVDSIRCDFNSGAALVTLETRANGKGGICQPNGDIRQEVMEKILDATINHDSLIFEAPSTYLQTYFVKRIGPNVNLGNINMNDIVGVETIRLGLRFETMGTGIQ